MKQANGVTADVFERALEPVFVVWESSEGVYGAHGRGESELAMLPPS